MPIVHSCAFGPMFLISNRVINYACFTFGAQLNLIILKFRVYTIYGLSIDSLNRSRMILMKTLYGQS